MNLIVRIEGEGVARLSEVAKILGSERSARGTYSQAINKIGGKKRTHTKRTLTKQTGLPSRVINRALRVKKARPVSLTYEISARGGKIALKYFKARETRKGVSAAPGGKRQLFKGAFMKAGRFPNRVDFGRGDHAFTPLSGSRRWGRPFKKAYSNIAIPEEMVSGNTANQWESGTGPALAQEVNRLIQAKTKGAMS